MKKQEKQFVCDLVNIVKADEMQGHKFSLKTHVHRSCTDSVKTYCVYNEAMDAVKETEKAKTPATMEIYVNRESCKYLLARIIIDKCDKI